MYTTVSNNTLQRTNIIFSGFKTILKTHNSIVHIIKNTLFTIVIIYMCVVLLVGEITRKTTKTLPEKATYSMYIYTFCFRVL